MKQLSTFLLCFFFLTNAFAQKETFDLSYLPDIYFGKENGTYKIDGNTITIIPQASVLETWSKGAIINAEGNENVADKLGKLKSRQNRSLEKVTNQFTSQYFFVINVW